MGQSKKPRERSNAGYLEYDTRSLQAFFFQQGANGGAELGRVKDLSILYDVVV